MLPNTAQASFTHCPYVITEEKEEEEWEEEGEEEETGTRKAN